MEYEADDKNGFNAVVHKIGTPKEEPKFEHIKYEQLDHKYEAPKYENFHHDFQQFDEGFVPVVGGYNH